MNRKTWLQKSIEAYRVNPSISGPLDTEQKKAVLQEMETLLARVDELPVTQQETQHEIADFVYPH